MNQHSEMDDRMFLRGEAVYEQIVRGEDVDVSAALWNAKLEESTEEN